MASASALITIPLYSSQLIWAIPRGPITPNIFHNAIYIRIVFNNYVPLGHAMHLHGHNYWVLSAGPGLWEGSIVNAANPQRRDVQVMAQAIGDVPYHLSIELETDDPRVWPLHSHVVAHVAAGMYINVMERPDLITEKQISSVVAETCRKWAVWSGTHVVDQIDSGL